MEITIIVNGAERQVMASAEVTLLSVLGDQLVLPCSGTTRCPCHQRPGTPPADKRHPVSA
jgi:aerobic-type carbon monoxide dehydrogenase small subunit (CoxS/CutS family)